MVERLERYAPALFYRVREILSENKAQRHLRGGEATRRKYLEKHLAEGEQSGHGAQRKEKKQAAGDRAKHADSPKGQR